MLFGENGHLFIAPESILQRIQAGDKSAEQALFKQYSRQLNTILVQKSRDPELAADLVQDTFMVVLEKARQNKIENPQALGTFIRQVGVNLLTASYRKETRRKTEASDNIDQEHAGHSINPSDGIQASEIKQLVIQMLDELPTDRDRDMLRRHFVYHQSKAMICQEYALTPAHFDRVIHRARQRLKQLMQHNLGSQNTEFDFRWLFAPVLFFLAFYSLSEKPAEPYSFITPPMGEPLRLGDYKSIQSRHGLEDTPSFVTMPTRARK